MKYKFLFEYDFCLIKGNKSFVKNKATSKNKTLLTSSVCSGRAASAIINPAPNFVGCALIETDQYTSQGAKDFRLIKVFVFDDEDFMNSSVNAFNQNSKNMQKRPSDPFLGLISMIPMPETVFQATAHKLLPLFKERKTLLSIQNNTPNMFAPTQKNHKI